MAISNKMSSQISSMWNRRSDYAIRRILKVDPLVVNVATVCHASIPRDVIKPEFPPWIRQGGGRLPPCPPPVTAFDYAFNVLP